MKNARFLQLRDGRFRVCVMQVEGGGVRAESRVTSLTHTSATAFRTHLGHSVLH
jgi:hypothetical protein